MPEINFFAEEEKVLRFWKENRIFEKSVESRSSENPASFYDGPPFVTGVPHYGHLLGSIAKDIIPRYLAMKGKRVRRVWGWDCHGLPVENKVEQKLGLKNRRDIERVGLLKFNTECRNYVSEISAEWDWYIDHVGRWVDTKNAYRTMDLSYMESVIWAFKKLYDQNLIYKGKRISLFCPRCSTPVSHFEIAMDNSYADRTDPAITIKFKVIDEEFLKKYQLKKPCYLLAWTTTPWSCVSVMGLALGEKFIYQLVEAESECYLLSQKRAKEVMKERGYEVKAELSGQELLGLKYEPVFDYYRQQFNDFKTWPADYVSQDEGTGIVTINGAFGEVDMDSCRKYNLPVIVNVDEEGKFTPEVLLAPGVYIEQANKLVIEDLEKRNLLFQAEQYVHSYPFCYRCETPLIYLAQDSWFVDVQKLKKELLKNNESICWVPDHFKEGRFRQGLETAPDWCVSRTRYWATAMPVWECQSCREREVFGSVAEIEARSGQKVHDLHRPFIDEIKFKCQRCQGTMERVKEVLDCWMESGSMPYAQRHYPFENKIEFEKSFPADYISEYTGQVRAWFYVLHVLSTALFNSPAFKNVVVSGVIMGTDGRKMSKSFHNYPDPRQVIEKYGGDALRLYLMGSPTMAGQDMNMAEDGVRDQVKNILLNFWNCYLFYAMLDENNSYRSESPAENVLDKWLLSRAQGFLKSFTSFLDEYRIPEAVRLVPGFLEDLSCWYIRRSRQRLKDGDEKGLAVFYQTLLLFAKTVAPLMPFIAEIVYKKLNGPKESVHLEDWPVVSERMIDEKLEAQMEEVRQICCLGNAIRKEAGIKLRQPLPRIEVKSLKLKLADKELVELLKAELNVKEVRFVDNLVGKPSKASADIGVMLNTDITPELKEEGLLREVIRQIQDQRKRQGLKPRDKIIIRCSPDEFLSKRKETLLQGTATQELVFCEKYQPNLSLELDGKKLSIEIKKID